MGFGSPFPSRYRRPGEGPLLRPLDRMLPPPEEEEVEFEPAPTFGRYSGLPAFLAGLRHRGGHGAGAPPTATERDIPLDEVTGPPTALIQTPTSPDVLNRARAVTDTQAEMAKSLEAKRVPVVPASAPNRAVRLPSGRVVFTNTGQADGQDIDRSQAIADVRARDEAAAGALGGGTSGLLGASMRRREYLADAGAPEAAPGVSSPAARTEFGFLNPHFEQEAQNQRLSAVLGAAALGHAQQEAEVASLPATEAAALGNVKLQTIIAVRNAVMRSAVAQAKTAALAEPDPTKRQAIIEATLADAELNVANILKAI